MAQEINDRDYSLIRIRDLKIFGHHGVLPEETEKGQNFYVCVDAYQDIKAAASMDELMLTTNYADMCDHIVSFLTENTFKLIETAADEQQMFFHTTKRKMLYKFFLDFRY